MRAVSRWALLAAVGNAPKSQAMVDMLQVKPLSPALCTTLRRVLALAAAILFVVFTRLPVAIHADYPHDDGLFMALGERLASGEWLGAYSQFTLIKGPGYPLFLAFNSWLGLPVTLSHALFHCGAIGFFFWVFARITRMSNLAVWGFVFTLWAPVDYFDRITRDAIYPGQMLLVLGTLSYALLGTMPRAHRISWAAMCGLAAGWFVLTREEGIWIAPGLAIIGLYALYVSWRKRSVGADVWAPMMAIALVFMSTHAVFVAVNKFAYGAAIGLETKSAPFTDALRALHAVRVGEPTAYLPVSREARMAIYRESPSFRSLKGYFDPAGSPTPWQFGCQFYPATCGDIAGGWFLWALRDAVSTQGAHSSPASAADFYRRLAAEIEAACRGGRLTCSDAPPAPLSHISEAQWRKLPASLASGILLATYAQPPDITPEPSSGDAVHVASSIAFLGYPPTTPVRRGGPGSHTYFVHGWYRSPSNRWVSGEVVGPDGRMASVAIPRMASPDLVTGFKDANATHQRFNLELACSTPCIMRFTGDDGASVQINLTELVGQRPHYSVGPATLNIDSVSEHGAGSLTKDVPLRTATAVRRAGIEVYSAVLPWLASFAVIAMLLATVRAAITRRLNTVAVLAVAMWVLLASRLVILGVVDISLFPGMITQYLSTANVLVCLAVVLSFGAFIKSMERSRST